ncbi:hypothetical protein QYF36_010591 [Acer negundo]|nr:hypothetical protein QYF36_010591 [Acer negundo]
MIPVIPPGTDECTKLYCCHQLLIPLISSEFLCRPFALELVYIISISKNLKIYQVTMEKQAHVLVIPLQAQGHLMPIMKFSHGLAKHGIKITIVNTESTHNQILNSLAKEDDIASINLVSCPNVYDYQQVKKLIQQMNDDEKITCVLVDSFLAWNMEAAAELGIKTATICCFSATHFLPIFDLPKLIQHGVIDNQGIPKQKMFQLSPTIPSMSTSRMGWVNPETRKVEKYVFEFASKINKSMALTEWVLCNSSYDLEAEAFKMYPKMLPIGPLLSSNRSGEEIKNKLDELLGSDKYKANAMDLKEKLMNSVKEGGNSYNNFMSFVEWVKT